MSSSSKKSISMSKRPEKSEKKISVSDEVVVRFDSVTKTYKLFKNDLSRLFSILKGKADSCVDRIDASKNISFEIRRGEGVAFLGHNGAGKSTALKMINGITSPTEGTIEVKGHVSALIELSAGFDTRLTGRENIHLRGQILGMSRDLIQRIEPEVIEFAQLGAYIDQPMRTYSSGMKARLGFAFSVAIDPDILIVDEALSVGDRVFRKKCLNRIREIMKNDQVTVLFVTHSSSMAREFCSRGIVLDGGQMLFDGPIDEAIAFYDQMN